MGVQLQKVRSAIEFIIGRGEGTVLGEIGLTPRAKTVLELSVDEGIRLQHHYVGTAHLLLGLVREGEGIAAGVLESLGLNLEKVRAQVQVLISQSYRPGGISDIPSPRDSSGRVSRQLILKAALNEFLEPQNSGVDRTDAEVRSVNKVIGGHQISDQAWPHVCALVASISDNSEPKRLSESLLAALLGGPPNAAASVLESHAISLKRMHDLLGQIPRTNPEVLVDNQKAVISLLHRAVLETESTGPRILGTTHLLSAMVYRSNTAESSAFRSLEVDLYRMRIELDWIHACVASHMESTP